MNLRDERFLSGPAPGTKPKASLCKGVGSPPRNHYAGAFREPIAVTPTHSCIVSQRVRARSPCRRRKFALTCRVEAASAAGDQGGKARRAAAGGIVAAAAGASTSADRVEAVAGEGSREVEVRARVSAIAKKDSTSKAARAGGRNAL